MTVEEKGNKLDGLSRLKRRKREAIKIAPPFLFLIYHTHAFSIALARVFGHGLPTVLRDIKACMERIRIVQNQVPSH
jgi:hypothetical protein